MAAGKDVMHLVYEGIPHGFFEVEGWEETARECKNVMCIMLKRYMK